ncbi:MAG: hypothetical protein V3W20_11280 [Candidatus Neomarinimicrobiota bacterium]
MKRIYHDYRRWEDFKNGMWRKVSKTEHEKLLPIAVEFTGDHEKYGSAMMEVIQKWKYSCENNLTDSSLNKKAWVGHAACSFKLNLPECVVRSAWKLLTDEQRYLANNQADIAINMWVKKYLSKETRQLEIW